MSGEASARAGNEEPAPYRFGAFSLCPKRHELRRNDRPVSLGERAVAILLTLIKCPGEIVSKEVLFERVWNGRAVENNNLTVQMSALRRVLAEDGPDASYIRTFPGRGYMFVPPGAALASEAGPDTPPAAALARLVQPGSFTPLPQVPTPFIGRAGALADLAALLAQHRLVTILGIGGIGKTRLALEVGHRITGRFPDGVTLVDLATVTDESAVVEAVATAVGAGASTLPAQAALSAVAAARRGLLILDNAEHVLSAVRGVIQALLTASGLTVLVTSRSRLDVVGEAVLRLQPHRVPETDAANAEDALGTEAVQFFVDRARALIADFRLDGAGIAAVCDICRSLDGIALAIEMAVPRLQILSVAQMAQRLRDRVQVLGPAPAGALPRQRTLQAMFDWSWELLRPAERTVLQVLAIFVGGAPLGGVLALSQTYGLDEGLGLEALTGLADNSLIVPESARFEPRYRLLETTRQYVLGRLDAVEAQTLRRLHATFFAERFEEAEAKWATAQGADWITQHGGDADNLRAALGFALASDSSRHVGLRLAAASYPLWWDLPGLPLREGRRWLDRAIAAMNAGTPEAVQARLWFGHSWRDVYGGDVENFAAADRAVALFRRCDDAIGLGAALLRAGSAVLRRESLATAQAIFTEAERVLRAQGPSRWLSLCLVRRGDILVRLGRYSSALTAYEEAIGLARGMSCWHGLTAGGIHRADLLFRLDRRQEASEALAALRSDLPAGRRGLVAGPLAAQLALAERGGEVAALVTEVTASADATGLDSALAAALAALALVHTQAGDDVLAARLAGFAGRIRGWAEATAAATELAARLDAALAAALDATALAHWQQVGAAMGEAEVLRLIADEWPSAPVPEAALGASKF